MAEFFYFLRTGLVCATVLGIAFVIALSLPKSKFQTVVSEICSWAAVALCGLYVVSPMDSLPEVVLGPVGIIDDIGAIFLAWQAYKSAQQCRVDRKAFG